MKCVLLALSHTTIIYPHLQCLLRCLYVLLPITRPDPQLTSTLAGDIADDKYFRKSNDSDATQFAMLFPRVPAHGKPPSLARQPPAQTEQADVRRSFPYAAWAALWIAFELGVLVGFMLLGIVAFKRTDAQMYREAGGWDSFCSSVCVVLMWGRTL